MPRFRVRRRLARVSLVLHASSVLAQEMASRASDLRVAKRADRETVVEGTFSVERRVMFDAITNPEHLQHWMSAGGMTLSDVKVDPRAGGSFRYVFQRPSGPRIEVRGDFRTFDPPRGFAYRESYDFSPLEIEVTTTLDDAGGGTRFTQTLRYFTRRERHEDFDGVARSSREAYGKLTQHLGTGLRKP